jgi:hypothetical protein
MIVEKNEYAVKKYHWHTGELIYDEKLTLSDSAAAEYEDCGYIVTKI